MADSFLHMAVERRMMKNIKFELRHGANVNLPGKFNCTALHIACRVGSKSIIRLLLEYGADINARSEKGYTPLHSAFNNKNYDAAKLLLNAKLDVNATSDSMETPLHLFIQYFTESNKDAEELLDSLLRLGANFNVRDEDDRTALHLAVRYRRKYAVNIFLDKNPNVNDENNKIAFLDAIINSRDNQDMVEIFLNRGFVIDPEYIYNCQVPKFMCARFKRSSVSDKVVQDLLKREVTPNVVLEYKVLRACVSNGFLGIFRQILRPDMNGNALLDDGCTLLHIACRKYKDVAVYKNIIKELLKRGARVDAVDLRSKRTPLHESCRYQTEDIVRLLLKHGADLEARNVDGETPLFTALRENHSNVQVLLDAGADVNSVGKNGLRPLHVAAMKGCEYCVNLLLYYEAEIDVMDDENESPADLAEKCEARRIANILLDNGAKIRESARFHIRRGFRTAGHKIMMKEMHNFETDTPSGMEKDFIMRCREEIQKMRCEKIGYNVSLYDILTKSDDDVARYARNENIINILNAGRYERRFPLYGNMLKFRVLKARKKNLLLNLSALCLETILEKRLPELVTREIFSYVDNVDLRNLINVAPIDENKKALVRCGDSGVMSLSCCVGCKYDSDSENHVDSYHIVPKFRQFSRPASGYFYNGDLQLCLSYNDPTSDTDED